MEINLCTKITKAPIRYLLSWYQTNTTLNILSSKKMTEETPVDQIVREFVFSIHIYIIKSWIRIYVSYTGIIFLFIETLYILSKLETSVSHPRDDMKLGTIIRLIDIYIHPHTKRIMKLSNKICFNIYKWIYYSFKAICFSCHTQYILWDDLV